MVKLAADEFGPDERLASASGEFRFYFPGRVSQGYPGRCSDLHGFRVFVLLTDEGTKAYMRDVAKVPFEPAQWASCTSPTLVQLSEVPGYTLFRVEG